MADGNPDDNLKITLDPQLKHPKKSSQTLDRGFKVDDMLIVLDFFDGGERDKVTISLNGKVPVNMELKDPTCERQYKKYKGTDDSSAIS
ncbi:hypothetical protein [Arcticibacterium luteifluviistationis]|uniref:Uncharacterized protein n=1 Tax=Arcticibacterium luteifluviistationis TaxID=1784714 RepID=A0A2Z4G7F8_9BACT|nr:hypothetical protein [Arcticibacterium luteifluviistationis]AWV97089.1 hypothetical protein DJ013_02415 [Arcticibacterium luteifluviistationis]